nr:M3 family oligoendopeptidase [Paenibacillus sp. HB172176]
MNWNLDIFYPGGSKSTEFEAELAGLEQATADLNDMLNERLENEPERIAAATALSQDILLGVRQAASFAACLMAQDVKDRRASLLNDRVNTIHAKFMTAMTSFDHALRALDEAAWNNVLSFKGMSELAFNLTEHRELAKLKMAPELEAIVSDLSIDGYHGWADLYNVIVSRASFHAKDADGKESVLSAGQMHNRLSDGNRDVRIQAFEEWEREWAEQAELCADTLNRIAGFRLKLYEHRGWNSVLQEPLLMNRMSEATLNAMWTAVEAGKKLLIPYLERKAKLLGLEKLDWHDVEAPIGASIRTVPFDEAASFIIEQFRAFDPELAEFSERAFRKGWIEAEDRSGKRPGGFCTSFPKSGETRIFMTYSGSASNISTLAHELGHAYHQHVMNDLPAMAQEYAMNVAETASTFAELIVSDRAMKEAKNKEEKIGLLEDKIQRSLAFFMNIHARFLFETRFYELRRKGPVSVEALNRLMEDAQHEAFSGMLGRKHGLFWASKLHFYLTDVPFYNFPYTFGYLFSAGLYARSAEEGFAASYVALLRDTGRLTVEQLAAKHLHVNLEEPDFWNAAVALTDGDVKLFLELTEE